MRSRWIVAAGVLVVLLAETVYFGRQIAADILRLRSDRAFFRNDLAASLDLHEQAVGLGGDPARLEAHDAQTLLFALDQIEAGVRVNLQLTPKEAVERAAKVVADLILVAPHKAFYWALASDVYFHKARQRRLMTPLDISNLTEDPLGILLPEDRLAIGALVVASRLEPHNYLYQQMLCETFLQIGSTTHAAPYCRQAIRVLPDVDDHVTWLRPDLPGEIVAACLQGFEDALRDDLNSIPRAQIVCDAGRFLLLYGQDRPALGYLERAFRMDPLLADVRYQMGQAYYRLKDYHKAIEHLQAALATRPDGTWPAYYLGMSYRGLGDLDNAIRAFTRMRASNPREVRFFHTLAETLEEAGRADEAGRQYLAAAALNPENVVAWAALLEFDIRHADWVAASEACDRLLTLAPQEALYSRRCALLESGAP